MYKTSVWGPVVKYDIGYSSTLIPFSPGKNVSTRVHLFVDISQHLVARVAGLGWDRDY